MMNIDKQGLDEFLNGIAPELSKLSPAAREAFTGLMNNSCKREVKKPYSEDIVMILAYEGAKNDSERNVVFNKASERGTPIVFKYSHEDIVRNSNVGKTPNLNYSNMKPGFDPKKVKFIRTSPTTQRKTVGTYMENDGKWFIHTESKDFPTYAQYKAAGVGSTVTVMYDGQITDPATIYNI